MLLFIGIVLYAATAAGVIEVNDLVSCEQLRYVGKAIESFGNGTHATLQALALSMTHSGPAWAVGCMCSIVIVSYVFLYTILVSPYFVVFLLSKMGRFIWLDTISFAKK